LSFASKNGPQTIFFYPALFCCAAVHGAELWLREYG